MSDARGEEKRPQGRPTVKLEGEASREFERLRGEAGMSLEEWAEALGVSYRTYYDIRLGRPTTHIPARLEAARRLAAERVLDPTPGNADEGDDNQN